MDATIHSSYRKMVNGLRIEVGVAPGSPSYPGRRDHPGPYVGVVRRVEEGPVLYLSPASETVTAAKQAASAWAKNAD